LPCNGLEKPTFILEFEHFKVGILTWKFKSSIRRPNSSIPDHRRPESTERPTLMLIQFFKSQTLNRYVTKIKNCSGFMRVLDSESLVLTDRKNNFFTKIGGTKKIHGSNSRGTSRTQRPSTKFFFKARIYRKFGVFWKACIVSFQKSDICPNK
jgi:hypothetical protein